MSGSEIDSPNRHPDGDLLSSAEIESVPTPRSRRDIAIAGISGIALVLVILALDFYLALKYLR